MTHTLSEKLENKNNPFEEKNTYKYRLIVYNTKMKSKRCYRETNINLLKTSLKMGLKEKMQGTSERIPIIEHMFNNKVEKVIRQQKVEGGGLRKIMG